MARRWWCLRQPNEQGMTTQRGTHLPRITGARRGQSLVEMALMMPVLILILLGTLDFARVFIYYVRLTDAVNNGALYGANVPNNEEVVRCRTFLEAGSNTPAAPNASSCVAFTDGGLGAPGADPTVNFVVTVTCYSAIDSGTTIDCDDAVSGNAVQVAGTYPFRPLTSEIMRFFPSNFPLKKTVRMTI
jgi:Flp pilus assembly protein TadG